ncbi:hypothetical protein EV189_1175 [Motilibacter rhizosphaerae]|uniref:Uncharacterized protein n=1 Tax=Motilibacter rhizosphaerae TaxID=598652 RepID=A0A4Q7NSQ9_9ACTN|nr:hypothetical protein [Motilibacter rhizosphaerae]RZS89412.1 hypothetical protein EV189_1175 [Motilibacter rhizosphaerae]
MVVLVLDVADDNSSARVRVGTRATVVAVGGTDLSGVSVVRAEGGSCVTVAYAAQRDDLCEGQSATLG